MAEKVEVIRTEHLIAHDTILEVNGNPSIEEWKIFGRRVMRAEKFVQWYLGAWWNYGHKKWTRDAESFVENCGYKKSYLANCGSIYTSVKPSHRCEGLGFRHHMLVASKEYTESDQKKWLEKAEKGSKNKKGGWVKWTVAQFRKELKKPKERKERAKRLKALEDAGVPIKYGDALKLSKEEIPDDTIDCIITDPPYPKEFLQCWMDLSKIAVRVLKPSGFCVAYSGKLYLPEVIEALKSHGLIYYWQMILLHSGAMAGVQGRHINTGYKPILVFQKPPFKIVNDYFVDIIKGSGRSKDADEWQQSEEELKPLFEIFTAKGDVVLDPFCGTGTVLNMCVKLKRQGMGYDIRKP